MKFEQLYTEDEQEIRSLVLLFSISIETLISDILRAILNIKRPSRSFGNTSAALSFNQKVNLLIDTEFIDKDDRIKFVTFLEIRNQFIHNIEAKSFKDCLSFLDGKDKFLKREFPNNEKTEEKVLLHCWMSLLEFINKKIEEIILSIEENGPKRLGDDMVVYFNQKND